MSTATQRKAKKAKAETAKAEEFIEEQVAKVTKPRGSKKWAHVTAEDITQARDSDGLSWRDVATKLGLGSPSTARAAYTDLTGRSHKDSQMTGRRARTRTSSAAAVVRPEWNFDTDVDTITEAITGRMIVVKRSGGHEEEIIVRSVADYHEEGDATLVVNFWEKGTGAARSVNVETIVDVR